MKVSQVRSSWLREVPRLSESVLQRLFEREVAVVLVRDFANQRCCRAIADWARKSAEVERYGHEVRQGSGLEYRYYGVDRIGVPFNGTLGTRPGSDSKSHYYGMALPNIRRLREVASPFLSPIDQLRLELDEVWPAGATIACYEGQKMFVGMTRLMLPRNSAKSEQLPHFDRLSEEVASLDGQVAANVYVEVPKRGGELEVWADRDDCGGSAGISQRPRSEPTVVLPPRAGDLVLFDSTRLHGVRRFEKGVRISVQSFIGFKRDEPLAVWN